MLIKTNAAHTPLLAALLGVATQDAAHAEAVAKNPSACPTARLQEDIFTLRMRAAYRCYGAAHDNCAFYLAVPKQEEWGEPAQGRAAQDGVAQSAVAARKPAGPSANCEAEHAAPTGLLCVQGRSAIYSGGLHDADELQAFLAFLQVETFKSNSMLLPDWQPVPQYLMRLPAGVAVHVCAVMVDEHPDLWQLAHCGVLSGIDPAVWYADTCVRVNNGVADVRAIAAPQLVDVHKSAEKVIGKATADIPTGTASNPDNIVAAEHRASCYVATAGAYAIDAAGIYITAVETAPEHRGCGYGCTLISSLAHDYASKDKWLICEPALHGFYEQLGFVFARPVCEYRAPET